MEQLKGTGVALVTPFTEDLSVDFGALQDLVEHCITGGVDYLVVMGTTGESVTLSKAEKQRIADAVVQINAGRLPLVLGVGGNNTAVVEQELKTLDLSDFDAVLSVSPCYNKPTQEGIYQHFKVLANASPKPIILYNVPSRTGSNILAETTLRLAKDCPNIIAIKEASGDQTQIDHILKDKPKDFLVISGDDFTALSTVLAGGAGVISVLGQGLPKMFSDMINLGLQGDAKASYQLHQKLLPLMHLIFEEGNPAGIKTVLEKLNITSTQVRLPLVQASPALKQKIGDFLKTLEQAYA